jgi:hypothetical protein
MNKIFHIIAHAIYAFGLFMVILIPKNKYDWMQEMDPSISAHMIENASGNNFLFISLTCVFVIFAQLILVIKARKVREKIVSVALIFLALVVWRSKALA